MSFSTEIITVIIGGFITWFLNEKSKRIYENYKRKEAKYTELIKSLRGFYVDSFSKELRDEFLNQLNQCWMYCPDDVIEKAYKFLETIREGKTYSDKKKEIAVGEFILAIRKDLISRKPLKETNLKSKDFKHLKAI